MSNENNKILFLCCILDGKIVLKFICYIIIIDTRDTVRHLEVLNK